MGIKNKHYKKFIRKYKNKTEHILAGASCQAFTTNTDKLSEGVLIVTNERIAFIRNGILDSHYEEVLIPELQHIGYHKSRNNFVLTIENDYRHEYLLSSSESCEKIKDATPFESKIDKSRSASMDTIANSLKNVAA